MSTRFAPFSPTPFTPGASLLSSDLRILVLLFCSLSLALPIRLRSLITLSHSLQCSRFILSPPPPSFPPRSLPRAPSFSCPRFLPTSRNFKSLLASTLRSSIHSSPPFLSLLPYVLGQGRIGPDGDLSRGDCRRDTRQDRRRVQGGERRTKSGSIVKKGGVGNGGLDWGVSCWWKGKEMGRSREIWGGSKAEEAKEWRPRVTGRPVNVVEEKPIVFLQRNKHTEA